MYIIISKCTGWHCEKIRKVKNFITDRCVNLLMKYRSTQNHLYSIRQIFKFQSQEKMNKKKLQVSLK